MDLLLPNAWMWTVVIVLTVFSIGFGVYRNLRFRRIQMLHNRIANDIGLKLVYADARNFTLFGDFRSYPVRMEPISLVSDTKNPHWGIKISIPMVNPTLKALRIAKSSPSYPYLEQVGKVFRPVEVPHKIADELRIETNDFMFCHLILSDDVKMDLVVLFKALEAGVVYLQDDELSCVLPDLIRDQPHLQIYHTALELLCNMKDELN